MWQTYNLLALDETGKKAPVLPPTYPTKADNLRAAEYCTGIGAS
jgi:hypothetical protein